MASSATRRVFSDPLLAYHQADGPERILSFYDPASRMRAVIVIDTTALGVSAGGVRMLPDLSLTEMIRLARAMTFKYLMLEVRCGGAKAGVWYNSATQDRTAVWQAFLNALRPFVEQRLYFPGTDMGTTEEDFRPLYADGARLRSGGLLTRVVDGLSLEEQLTGFGVVESLRVATDFWGVALRGATVAIEGFGKVGGGAARFCARAGARVVAVSTLAGARYDPNGLDVEQLLTLRKSYGDESVCQYAGGRMLSSARLLTLPADVLIPGTRPDVITHRNVDRIRAKVIVPGANIPFTREIADRLSARGVGVVPDFVANGGGVLAAIAEIKGLDEAEAFASVRDHIATVTALVLRRSQDQRCTPFTAALRICRERWQRTAPAGRVWIGERE